MLKGGPGKTTSAWYLALAMSRRGEKVVAIDTDSLSQGLSDWHQLAISAGLTVPFAVRQWFGEPRGLAAFVAMSAAEVGATRVVIDTGGEQADMFGAACVVAQQLIAPVGPMLGEIRRVPATMEAAARADAIAPIDCAVLLTRVSQPGRGAAKDAREALEQAGAFVLATEIGDRRTEFASAWGTVPADLSEYGRLVEELETERQAA